MPKVRTTSPGSDVQPEKRPSKVKEESKEATDTPTKSDEKVADAAITPPGAVADAGSKKRAREDDDGAEEQRSTKKLDSKGEEQ